MSWPNGAVVVGAVVVLPMVLASGQWIPPVWPLGPAERALVLSSVIHAFMYAGYVWLAASAGAVFATQTSYVVTAAGIGWATASLATVYLFERRSTMLIVIDGGDLAMSYAAMGAIIGVWP